MISVPSTAGSIPSRVDKSPITKSTPAASRLRLLRTLTLQPASCSRLTTRRPSVPVPPVTNVGVFICPPLSPGSALMIIAVTIGNGVLVPTAGGGREGGSAPVHCPVGLLLLVPGPGVAVEERSFAVDAPPLIAGGARALPNQGIEKRVLGAQYLEGTSSAG